MTCLDFVVTFHSPYLSSTGRSAAGYDATVDRVAPVRESAIKGAMRAAARRDLQAPDDLLAAVFGSEQHEANWQWLVHPLSGMVGVLDAHRVAIDDDTHTASDDQLLRMRVATLESVRFSVTSRRSEATSDERLLVTASARAVHALGAQRRRGLGWVSVAGGDDLDAHAAGRIVVWRNGPDRGAVQP